MIGNPGCLKTPEQPPAGQCRKLDRLGQFALRQFVEHLVTKTFNVSREDLQCATRGRARVAFARQVAMYLCHVTFGISMFDVGVIFERDRTTVAHACTIVEDLRDDAGFDFVLDQLACTMMISACRKDKDLNVL